MEGGHLYEEDRSVLLAGRPHLEAWRFDPAGDRPERFARDTAADGALLCVDRERRQASTAPPAARRRANGCLTRRTQTAVRISAARGRGNAGRSGRAER